MRLAILCVAGLVPMALFGQKWDVQVSGTQVSLRGVSVVSSKVVWASGAAGTWLRTTDGGSTWHAGVVEGAVELDFRSIRASSETTAFLMSSGPGDKSRLYRTTDGGSHWKLLFSNPDAKGFFDGLAFWDPKHGVIAGDPVEGQFTTFTTADGGEHWVRRKLPPALPNEGAFAASNSCLTVRGKREAWLGTGGPGGGRVFRTTDGGLSWTVATTPVRNDGAGAGIFSLVFSDAKHGIGVGGDYAKVADPARNLVATSDGGLTWTTPTGTPPGGYRSSVIYLKDRKVWVAVGSSGSDISIDGGVTWKSFDKTAFNALGAIGATAVWAVGPRGKVARLGFE